MLIEARAKVNWTLDIVGQRSDGYHLLDMLMQPITLCDLITVEESDHISLSLEPECGIPADHTNLVWRAAEALRTAADYRGGAQIRVEKRIPSGAGLGGGSADAAGVLCGLNRLWELGLSTQDLEKIGLTIGADVPFCIRGTLARVTGIGEHIQSLPDAPEWALVIVQPCDGLSTREVFKAYHDAASITRPDTPMSLQALLTNNLSLLSESRANVLEGVSTPFRPQIAVAVEMLRENGADCAGMSGSGSAVFGAFADDACAKQAYDTIRQRWSKCFLCRSCRESIVIR